ncbi:MAG: methylated-DNA--[protein]-cysteine S-methyltransferase [Methanomicrobiales archaeon]|nr:methylated-DNA--[protein]-cysteine S-methyltransferase [Methanomicrobiales archaeon]
MAVITGSAKFGLWYVEVSWEGNRVYRVRFSPSATIGPVPAAVQRYVSGLCPDFSALTSPVLEEEGVFAEIYHCVRAIPYGETRTYGQIAQAAGTGPRVVGNAMARNPVPLIIPCHRVVAANGLGGFTPSLEIKKALLAMEQKTKRREGRSNG